MGQTITQMEYFFDDDPGYGMANSVTITPGSSVTQAFNAPTGSLSPGFHDLFIRVRESGGIMTISPIGGSFAVGDVVTGGSSSATATVVAAFPNRLEVTTTGTFSPPETVTGGSGSATLTAFTLNWSVPESRLVYVDPSGAGFVQVEEIEYFFDEDPGYGMGDKFTAFSAAAVVNEMENIPTGSLSIGFHTLFIRAKAVGGVWGIPESRLVYVDPTGPGVIQVEELEYFFDQDPGYGMGDKFTAFTASAVVNEMENISTGALSAGFHTLFVRAKSVGNDWGVPESRLVYVDPSGAGLVQVEEIEYFFDQDPGYGMGTSFTAFTAADVVNQLENVSTGSLSIGFHTLFVRARSVGNTWGIPESRLVYVDPSGFMSSDIVALEYFVDQDPGVGMGTSVSVTTPGLSVTEMFTVQEGDLALGANTLSVRAQNSEGVWSMLETKTITVEANNVLDFDRDNQDYVSLNSNIVSADYSSGMTIEFWSFATETIGSGERDVFSINEPTNGDDILKMYYRADLNNYSLESNGLTALNSVGTIDENEWHHFAITISASGDLSLYQDGLLIEQGSGYPFPSVSDLIIMGAEVNSTGGMVTAGYFEGQIEDFRIWNAELPASEIQGFIGTQDLTGHPSSTSLIAHYLFDQGDAGGTNSSETTLTDETTNGNDGTLNGFALIGSISNWVVSSLPSSAALSSSTPTVQASGIQTSFVEETEVLIGINTEGDGARRIIAVKQGNTGFPAPIDGTYYEANPIFGSGADLGDGWFVIFNGFGSIERVTGLSAATEYMIAALEVNGVPGFESYNVTTSTDNPITVTTADLTGPTVVTQNISVSLDATGNASVTAASIDNGSSDNITIAANLILALDITDFDCTDLGDNTVTLTVTDEAGNSNDATATVTVIDDIDPVAVAQDIMVTLDATDQATITPADVDNGSSDNCTFTLSLDVTTFGVSEIGDNTVTLTATDGSGNAVNTTATVTVLGNNQAPTLSYIFYLDENSPGGTMIGAVVATDPEDDPLTYSILSGNTNDAFAISSTTGELTVNASTALDFETTPVFNLTVQADDGNGGISMVDITINLNDIIDENPLGLDDLDENISIYPNPVSGRLFVKVSGLNLSDLAVDIFTLSGKQVLSPLMIISKSSELIEIDIEGLESGMYLLKIRDQHDIFTKQVLVTN